MLNPRSRYSNVLQRMTEVRMLLPSAMFQLTGLKSLHSYLGQPIANSKCLQEFFLKVVLLIAFISSEVPADLSDVFLAFSCNHIL